VNLSSVGGFERCWEDRRSPSGWHLRQEAAASVIEQGQRTGLGAIVCERTVASGAKCRDGAASWHGALTIKPSPSAQQSPEEKDDEHNDHDTGLATAEIQCNEHQLHSNSLPSDSAMPKSYRAAKAKAVVNLRVSLVVVCPTNPSSSNPR
jgi:hypothetical protein